MGLCGEGVAAHAFEQQVLQLFLDLPDAGTGAAHVSCDFGIGAVEPRFADVHAGVQVFSHPGVRTRNFTNDLDGVLTEAFFFDVLFVRHALENAPGASLIGVFVVVGAAFAREVDADFVGAALGIAALFVVEVPVALLRDVCHERNAEGRVERHDGAMENFESVSHQVFLALLGGVPVQTEVGVDLVGLACHDSAESLTADVPQVSDGLGANVFADCGLCNLDEVVDEAVLGGVVAHMLLLCMNQRRWNTLCKDKGQKSTIKGGLFNQTEEKNCTGGSEGVEKRGTKSFNHTHSFHIFKYSLKGMSKDDILRKLFRGCVPFENSGINKKSPP